MSVKGERLNSFVAAVFLLKARLDAIFCIKNATEVRGVVG